MPQKMKFYRKGPSPILQTDYNCKIQEQLGLLSDYHSISQNEFELMVLAYYPTIIKFEEVIMKEILTTEIKTKIEQVGGGNYKDCALHHVILDEKNSPDNLLITFEVAESPTHQSNLLVMDFVVKYPIELFIHIFETHGASIDANFYFSKGKRINDVGKVVNAILFKFDVGAKTYYYDYSQD